MLLIKRGKNLKTAGNGKPQKSKVGVNRYFTEKLAEQGLKPLDAVPYMKSSSKIKDTDGRTVFEMKDVEVPAAWTQLAVDILVSKYFRKAGVPGTGHETSVQQVIIRLARTLAQAGEKYGYFDAASASVFEDELSYLLIHQIGAFNSPVWFNLGLSAQYGIEGSGGNFAWDPQAMRVVETKDAYSRPQCSACFIQSVDDDLMGLFQLMKNEAKLFKYGSGTGTNFSRIRGRQETLSGGGLSSGLMSFLEVFDKGAGATKSGGTTRRAAKMVCLDMDHPEIADFISWKMREERKVAALIAAGYSSDFNGEAYKTVSGQNANNSVRITDSFMNAVEHGAKWETRARTSGEVVDTYEARTLWKMIAEAAWSCADPGLQFDTTINDWHTCLDSGRINASNPCSEFMFLDDTACNLASLNLVKFLKEDGSFDIKGFREASRTFSIAQEILVGLSSYPTEQIAENSYRFRPLGLGYANLGTLLMLKGIPYDSKEGRSWAAAITAIMCGHAYAVSAEEAGVIGPFDGFAVNRESMLKVIAKHRDAAYKLDADTLPPELAQAAREDWDLALSLGEKNGYRNSQITVLAPTGTIGLLMDCDTTGVEPDFALVKFKKLAGGGYFKIVNQSVPMALKNRGYTDSQIDEIIGYLLGTMSLDGATHVTRDFLKSKGLTEPEIAKIEKGLPGTFELTSAFTRFGLGDTLLNRIGVPAAEYEKPTFSFLRWAGLTEAQINEANEIICGTMTVEGAPHLKEEHLAIFDCANKCGIKGTRFIAPMGHVSMMAAVQPFLSGAISKTVNVPHETTVEEIQDIYLQAWKGGLKAIALYRDGCKLSQPLLAKSEKKAEEPARTEVKAAASIAPVTAAVSSEPVRRKLPSKRTGFTQEANVAGHKVYIRTGEYQDGHLGEVFIDMHKEGAAYRAMMNCFAISVSLGLQYGVPLKEFVDKFTFTRFEPSGIVEGHANVKMATSIVDYIFRVLGMEYLGRTDFVQVKPSVDLTAEKGAAAKVYPKNPSQLFATAATSVAALASAASANGSGTLSGHLAEMMGDAPPCDGCGHTTVRNGACYKCLNCGNSMGCS
ncbi:MAG: ribonucleoside-diphosphate reductase, adenosylcobalamin-dependent [Bdellovibrionales bacterium GWB1_52_6]|nr:MAG: ribonucleoside-diphosphate reductase, adenosylcobalamin-dependent [Bdellovibrionales bacterium GWB1_52_6]OFZ02679.1 MAG: ribonucleoside-diphosphate reductase, adenosylcobalamin-dependent [Bdellovibrionales bacterium GWA1_52_35]HCM41501.1 vitamin B12-dependent ribonucleotide reductase [Bdellovibrionales bacterium]